MASQFMVPARRGPGLAGRLSAVVLACLAASCGGGGGDGSPEQTNRSPVANAGESRSAFVGESVTLDAGGSSDADGDSLTYRWNLVFAPLATRTAVSDASARSPTLRIDEPGIYTVDLTVDDGRGGTDTRSVSITTVAQGTLLDSAVAGVEYRAGDRSGTTDALGTFYYPIGADVQFRIGDILLGTVQGKSVVTPFDLGSSAGTAAASAATNLARVLQTLDEDAASQNGIQIPSGVREAAAGMTLNFAQDPQLLAGDANTASVMATLGARTQAGVRPMVSADAALQHLESTLLANMAGHYAGSLSGADTGTWSIDIGADGTVNGSGNSVAGGAFAISGRASPDGRLAMTWRFAASSAAVAANVYEGGIVSANVASLTGGGPVDVLARHAASTEALPRAGCGPKRYVAVTPFVGLYANGQPTLSCNTPLEALFILEVGPKGLNYDSNDSGGVPKLEYREKFIGSFPRGPGCSALNSTVGGFVVSGNEWLDRNGYRVTLPEGCIDRAVMQDQWRFPPGTPNLPDKQVQCGGTFDAEGYQSFDVKQSYTSRQNDIVETCKISSMKRGCVTFDLNPALALSTTSVVIPNTGTLDPATGVDRPIRVAVNVQPRSPASYTCQPWSVISNLAPFANVTRDGAPNPAQNTGTISISAQPNPVQSPRQGDVTIGFAPTGVAQTLTLIQNPDPTFIQGLLPRSFDAALAPSAASSPELVAKIVVPANGNLVRADIPVFGLAFGKQFKSYRLEFGVGNAPSRWLPITSSSRPQTGPVTLTDLYESADMTIVGNLGNWDTGLKEYVYLPSYPRHHPTDLRGTHTLRLIVEGVDGTTVEDRVTVQVANVVPNAWGGQVTSHDGRFVLTVPEHALMDSFRLVLAEPADMSAPRGKSFVGRAYAVREPGERFSQPSALEMHVADSDVAGLEPGRLAIHGYSAVHKRWERLDTVRRPGDRVLKANVRTLHAYYAVMASDQALAATAVEPTEGLRPGRRAMPKAVDTPHLVRNDFERDVGEWSNRHGEFGATLSLDASAARDGTKALKLRNANGGGSFAVNVIREPFDAREFPLVQFDYRIAPGVKTNFLVKVEGRWYEVRFTGDARDLHGKRVNIASIGAIEGVVSDDRWHTAAFDLHEMLRTRTRHTVVEEMIMADWDVPGYMKLRFGRNAKGAAYYIDNFMIRRDADAALAARDDRILVDDFDQTKASNALGGATSTFSSGASAQAGVSFVAREGQLAGYALRIDYDVPQAGFAGYVSALEGIDLRDHQALTLRVKRSSADADLLVGLKEVSGRESKLRLSQYLPQLDSDDWQEVAIPIAAFAGLEKRARLENLSFSFETDVHVRGFVLIDDVAFQRRLTSVAVDDFERADGKGALGVAGRTFATGAAAINGQVVRNSPNRVYRLSYGGSIGARDTAAGDLMSYAGWATSLGGIDCSRCKTLSFRIKGAAGGESDDLSIYLDDGGARWGVPLKQHATVTTEWQLVTIPLEDFAGYGVDMTHLAEIQLVFEWQKMSGTVYVDDIRLGRRPDSLE
jgi:PKD repeat protein